MLRPAECGALARAIEAARAFEGATAPNPAVGAAALNAAGDVIAVGAHARAGGPHAEADLIRKLEENGALPHAHTVVVTLEPCNHFGRTPPCAAALKERLPSLKRVVSALRDPNPKVAGGGERFLRENGLEVVSLDSLSDPLVDRARRLLAPFRKRVTEGLPWVTVKQAFDARGSMIPPAGQRTFTSTEALALAHRLRKRANAILTGSPTVFADWPEFTVRRVPDFPSRPARWMVVMSRNEATGHDPKFTAWAKQRKSQGFLFPPDNSFSGTLEEALRYLAEQGVLEVLVEAGPRLSAAVLNSGFWDENVVIQTPRNSGEKEAFKACLRESSKPLDPLWSLMPPPAGSP